MTPLEIKIELMKASTSQADIARQCGVSRSQVGRVVAKSCVSNHVMRAVAEAIGRPVERVFPEYFCPTDVITDGSTVSRGSAAVNV